MTGFASGVLLCVLLVSPGTAQRLRPPEHLPCDRNRLTSFTGAVTSYERKEGSISVRLRTDEATDEEFTVRHSKIDSPSKWFLMRGAVFKESDWEQIESEQGRLHPGMRMTVWVCEKSANPIFDWRPPEK